uniref:SHSP domain-containing protein n=1 Tax=Loa loa TaxID=7209 RepID=A0A1I7W3T8_LOALO
MFENIVEYSGAIGWHNFPMEGRHTVGGLMNRLLEDFEDSMQPFWECATAGENSLGEEFPTGRIVGEDAGWRLLVEGHHEERNDRHGSVEQHFIRKYTMPKNVLQDSLESHLSDQGILRITAKKKAVENSQFKNIPIQFKSDKQ